MATNMKENGFETMIVKYLVENNHYEEGSNSDYNKIYAIDEVRLFRFLHDTQYEKLAELRIEDNEIEKKKFLDRLSKKISDDGVINIIRKGMKYKNKTVDFYMVRPSEGNQEAKESYDKNIFSVTRQLRYSNDYGRLALDVCIFLNGLPIITMELKNQITKQNHDDAIRQYMTDRTPDELLFQFKRCIVHFAVDDDEIYMCTELKKEKSFFMPFNKGNNNGAGNPRNPNGLKTDYLWKDILTKPCLSNILENYVQITEEKDEDTGRKSYKQIFPRYHQLSVVTSLLADAKNDGPGHRYLIQHSAGSGKSNSIASLISFRGKYYYRSGSTMREITGKELERALLKTQGRTWDGVPLPKLTVADLKQDAIQLFKDKAVKRGRLTKEEVSVEDTILMDNLHLIDEDGYLIRAAMLAFYKDPEKWVTGSYIKIGYFGKSDSDLVYQDEMHGPLIEQVDKTVDLVYTKYMKALIDYEGVQRIEQFMFHKDAFREILLNAIVHKDYSSCNPIQISVYDDKIYIWNDGEMPPNLDSTDKLFMKHSSKPYNPKLANIFFKSGMIEAWGRGFEKIREACALYDGPLPEYEINEAGIMVLCKACDRYLGVLRNDGQHPDHYPNQNGQDVNKLIIDFCKDPKSVQEIMDEFDFDSRTSFRRKYLTPMLKNGVLKMTIPEKPSSKNQKYFS